MEGWRDDIKGRVSEQKRLVLLFLFSTLSMADLKHALAAGTGKFIFGTNKCACTADNVRRRTSDWTQTGVARQEKAFTFQIDF